MPLDVALAPRECSFPSPFPLNPVYCLYRIAKEVQGGGRGGHASGSVGRQHVFSPVAAFLPALQQ